MKCRFCHAEWFAKLMLVVIMFLLTDSKGWLNWQSSKKRQTVQFAWWCNESEKQISAISLLNTAMHWQIHPNRIEKYIFHPIQGSQVSAKKKKKSNPTTSERPHRSLGHWKNVQVHCVPHAFLIFSICNTPFISHYPLHTYQSLQFILQQKWFCTL